MTRIGFAWAITVALLATQCASESWYSLDFNTTDNLYQSPLKPVGGGLLGPVPFGVPTFSEWSSTHDVHFRDTLNGGSGDGSVFDRGINGDSGGGSQGKASPDWRGVTDDRFNYASIDCSAKVVMASKEAQGVTAIQIEDRDRYMLLPCTADPKFVVVELCDSILIDTVVLGNHELFSGVFRDFSVRASGTLPPSEQMDAWTTLGEYTAANARTDQIFAIEAPRLWARYIRIDIHSHYNNEHYCPLTRLRVHGVTMMQAFQQNQVPPRIINSGQQQYALAAIPADRGGSSEAPDGDGSESYDVEYFARFKDTLDVGRSPDDDAWRQDDASEESIFTMLTRRLSRLEANATLTARYLDVQRQALNEALNSVQRQNRQRNARLSLSHSQLSERVEALAMQVKGGEGALEEMRQIIVAQQAQMAGLRYMLFVVGGLWLVTLALRVSCPRVLGRFSFSSPKASPGASPSMR